MSYPECACTPAIPEPCPDCAEEIRRAHLAYDTADSKAAAAYREANATFEKSGANGVYYAQLAHANQLRDSANALRVIYEKTATRIANQYRM